MVQRRKTGAQAQIEIFNYFMTLNRRASRDAGRGPGQRAGAWRDRRRSPERYRDSLNCFLLILGGQETTRNAISGGIDAMISSSGTTREVSRRSFADADCDRRGVALDVADYAYHAHRFARHGTEGPPDQQGDSVVIWNASANRDEENFVEPVPLRYRSRAQQSRRFRLRRTFLYRRESRASRVCA